MSYSFTVRGGDKTEAKSKVSAQLDKVARLQTLHQHDQAQAEAAAHAFIDLLEDDGARDVVVSVHGSLSHHPHATAVASITSASIGVSAQLDARQTTQG